MTPEQQRIAIAEACGWVPAPDGRYTQDPAGLQGPLYRVQDLPSYLNDLNAMHEAEGVLDYRQLMEYDRQVEAKCARDGDDTSRISCVRATATQRAEAFLRTLNLWKP